MVSKKVRAHDSRPRLRLAFRACGASLTFAVATAGGAAFSTPSTADIIVYGTTPSGISAAIAAAKLGKKALILAPYKHLGGMVTSGISVTDAYPQEFLWAMSGFAGQFTHAVEQHYGATWTLGGTRHEPHVAESSFKSMLASQPNIEIEYQSVIKKVEVRDRKIVGITTEQGRKYSAQIFVDASYDGELMLLSGVRYVQGRESRLKYDESMAGFMPISLKEGARVDPYRIAGDPKSGLLPHISQNPGTPVGAEDTSMQAYGYRLCVAERTGFIHRSHRLWRRALQRLSSSISRSKIATTLPGRRLVFQASPSMNIGQTCPRSARVLAVMAKPAFSKSQIQ